MNEYEISLWEDGLVTGVTESVYAVTTSLTPVIVVNLDEHPEFAEDPYAARKNTNVNTRIPARDASVGTTLYVFASQFDRIKELIAQNIYSGTIPQIEFVLDISSSSDRYITCYTKEWTYNNTTGVITIKHPTGTTPSEVYFTLNVNQAIVGEAQRFANYFDEYKIGVIGSNTMTTICRAEEPKLIEKLNGTHTFSFKMRYVYNDNGVKYKNPWLDLLVNERKIKVKWNGRWYDFIIKNCDENSDSRSITYTCEDQFITELSKNGFSLEFAQELGNNQGTIGELASAVLKGTDWHVEDENIIIPQEIEEPVYLVHTNVQSHKVVDLDLYPDYYYSPMKAIDDHVDTTISDKDILVFYSQIQELISGAASSGNGLYLQFAFADEYQTESNTSQLVINTHRYTTCWAKYWEFDGAVLTIKNAGGVVFFTLNVNNNVSNYRAKRFVGSPKTTYDPLTKKYVTVYKAIKDTHTAISEDTIPAEGPVQPVSDVYQYFYAINAEASLNTCSIPIGDSDLTLRQYAAAHVQPSPTDSELDEYVWYYATTNYSKDAAYNENDIIYRYTDTSYTLPASVLNVLANNENFDDTLGWHTNNKDNNFTWGIHPTVWDYLKADPSNELSNYKGVSYLKVHDEKAFFNTGIRGSAGEFENGFAKTDQFILRIRPFYPATSSVATPSYITFGVNDKLKTTIIGNDGTVYFQSATNSPRHIVPENPTSEWPQWEEYTLNCVTPINKKKIEDNGLQVRFLYNSVNNAHSEIWIEKVELFKKITDNEGHIIYPGDLNKDSMINTHYKYYNHTRCEVLNLKDADEVVYFYDGITEFDPTEKEIQLQHNEGFNKVRSITAKESNRFNIIQMIAEAYECWAEFEVDHDPNTGQIIAGTKRVVFKQHVGEDKGLGFIYGIDLKSITRKIESSQIVTKTIVKPNNNEFAKNGFCTIARSTENYPRSEFILNFDYFISHGMLDQRELNKDLYLSTGIGYYYNLNQINTQYDIITEELSKLYLERIKLEALKRQYDGLITSTQEQIQALKSEVMLAVNKNDYNQAKAYIISTNNTDVIAKITTITELQNLLNSYNIVISQANTRLMNINETITDDEDIQENLVERRQALDAYFYQKYARFLQEGSWTSEEYVDDDLYYIDACSVAYTSSRPKVSYTINVIRVSSLEEFKNKVFHIGDIGYIQDTEFFGYTTIEGIKTPYKEKIIISEMSFNFEEPDKDTITVQNYKTQFDDLFQRITATTQSLQYASGEYALAATQVQPGGGLTAEAIQTTLDSNTDLVYSAQNQTIVQDSTGITVSDVQNHLNKTKITSGGLFITTDGGLTWNNAIRGNGIATQWLSSGTINTNNITLMDGNHPAFRWDSQGINAFATSSEEYGGINLGQFVRFDQYGVYGINNASESNYVPASESAIKEDAAFGLTWSGFFMKNKYTGHYVEVSNTNDIQVVDTASGSDIPVIKIGALDSDLYGIRINAVTSSTDESTGITTYSVAPVMETGSDGKLWLKDTLIVGDGTTSTVKIGYDPNLTRDDTQYHEVFHAGVEGKEFIVYEDGYVVATGLEINFDQLGMFTVDQYGLSYENGDTALIFDPTNGLLLQNTKFTINDANGIAVLNYALPTDDSDGGLSVTGNITATNLTVEHGNIGGFEIGETTLTSTVDNNYLVLNSAEPYILCGTGDVSDQNHKVKISPTLSEFTNVNVSGKLMTTIFEVNKTQIVGGSMVFKPSFKVTNTETYNENDTDYCKVYLEDTAVADNLPLDEYVIFVDENGTLDNDIYKIVAVDTVNNEYFTILYHTPFENMNPYGCVLLGNIENTVDGEEEQRNIAVAVGINSNDNSNLFLESKGITISELHKTVIDNKPALESKTKVFLGDLNEKNFEGFRDASLSGFGLFGNNVYLQGSLTTVVPPNSEDYTYAGVNTTTGVSASVFENDDSPIVFWAGASSLDSKAIQNALFQVTENGSIYAKQGVFRGKIEASDIYTSRIHGSHGSGSYGLGFQNIDNGIIFKSGASDFDSATLKFGIGTNGLFASNNQYFVDISTPSAVLFTGQFRTGNNLILKDNTLIYNAFSVNLNDNVNIAVNDAPQLTVNKNQIIFGDTVMRYEAVIGETISNTSVHHITETVTTQSVVGYDLYITEGESTTQHDLNGIELGFITNPITIGDEGGNTI